MRVQARTAGPILMSLLPPASCRPHLRIVASCLLGHVLTGLEPEVGMGTGDWKLELKVDGWAQMERKRRMGPREEGSFFAEAVTLTIP